MLRCRKPWLIAVLAFASTTACLRDRGHRLAVDPVAHDLTLVGTLVTADGGRAGGADIYADGLDSSLGVTDSDGAFRVTLSDDQLVRLAGASNPADPSSGRQSFQLWFELDGSPRLLGASTAIETGKRGEHALTPTTLAAPATLSGRVMHVPPGLRPEPAVGATLTLGRRTTVTGSDGSFAVADVPATALALVTSYASHANDVRPLSFAGGERQTLPKDILLFPVGSLSGALYVPATTATSASVDTGHPYLRSFLLAASSGARYMRAYHDASRLVDGTTPWQPISDKFDYDFPRDGANTLYYQFADATQLLLSPIFNVTVVIDQFATSTGCVIEDGSGRLNRRQALIHVDVPPAAYRMRFAESMDKLSKAAWEPALPLTTYTFELRSDDGQTRVSGLRELFCQFKDASHQDDDSETTDLGPVFRTSVIIDLFPNTSSQVFTIDGGAPETSDRVVRLDIQVPANAYEMRAFEGKTEGGSQDFSSIFGGSGGGTTSDRLWVPAQPQLFLLLSGQGAKTIYLQFRTIDGAVSSVYRDQITVLPFVNGDDGFVINNGAPVATSRHLDLTLIPPVPAYQWRVAGSQADLTDMPWRTLVPRAVFSVAEAGVHTIYVQYRNSEFEQSGVYTQTVLVEPFLPEDGQLRINGGVLDTMLRTVDLTIVAPPTARAMMIRERGDFSSFSWQQLRDQLLFTLSAGTGAKTIELSFQTEAGDTSPVISATIFYDPFPIGAAGLVINDGAEATSSETVDLEVIVPAAAQSMRIGNDPADLIESPFIDLRTQLDWTLASGIGPQKVYVQFQTAQGDLSPMYFDEIDRLPPSPGTDTDTDTDTD